MAAEQTVSKKKWKRSPLRKTFKSDGKEVRIDPETAVLLEQTEMAIVDLLIDQEEFDMELVESLCKMGVRPKDIDVTTRTVAKIFLVLWFREMDDMGSLEEFYRKFKNTANPAQ